MVAKLEWRSKLFRGRGSWTNSNIKMGFKNEFASILLGPFQQFYFFHFIETCHSLTTVEQMVLCFFFMLFVVRQWKKPNLISLRDSKIQKQILIKNSIYTHANIHIVNVNVQTFLNKSLGPIVRKHLNGIQSSELCWLQCTNKLAGLWQISILVNLWRVLP